jgi:assimilatory nitrate reductase catalytic subunit
VGCGVLVHRGGEAALEVAGDPRHPSNLGRLCSKGLALADTVGLEGRLLHPQIRGARVSWERALEQVARGFSETIERHGPQSVAFYVSGQLLTEDYYVANKLMKGFIGSANIDTNSRLCMSSASAGHERAFGEDLVPGCYEDFELADLVVLVGSNTAWCHPVLYQRIARAKERRTDLKLVVIDPRRTPTCDLADLHLPIRSGTDVWLFNGLLAYLHGHGHAEGAFIAAHTEGTESAVAAAVASAPDEESVARACGIDAQRVREFFRTFASVERVVTAFSQGVNQSTAGTDKVNAIINCHLLTGRIGRPGMGPFSVTGQPNAMGGREVGGMASTLAAHLRLESEAHRRIVQAHWASPRIASRRGLKAVELFEAMHAGRVKAVWIMATNPLVSLPDADRAKEALARCELVVVSDCVARTDSTRFAHVLLPAAAWGEKDGIVTSSERRISRQRAFLPLPGEARPDWWIVCEVAKRMGFAQAFDYRSPNEIFDEHARLSAAGNDGARIFDIGGLAGLSREQYDALEPVQWPVRRPGTPRFGSLRAEATPGATRIVGAQPEVPQGVARLFADGRFAHADGRARFVATPPRAPAHATDDAFPLVLNTGRIRDQWHSMTRTGRSARLAEHLPEPFLDLHGEDALLAGVRPGGLARVVTRWGSMVGRVRTSGEMKRGEVFAPIHWSAERASDARASALVCTATDPISGQPEFKHTPARVEPFVVDWFGVLVSRRPPESIDAAWWTAISGEDCTRYELAGRGVPADWSGWARPLLGLLGHDAGERGVSARGGDEHGGNGLGSAEREAAAPDEDYLDYVDAAAGIYRAARITGGRLEACLFVARQPELPERRWLMSLFSGARPRSEAGVSGGPGDAAESAASDDAGSAAATSDATDEIDRRALLAGRPLRKAADAGPLVCSCLRVGRQAIIEAIRAHGLSSPREVGARLGAGTQCGSCVSEIRALIAETER